MENKTTANKLKVSETKLNSLIAFYGREHWIILMDISFDDVKPFLGENRSE